MMLSILFRPLYLPEGGPSMNTSERVLNAYKQVCTAPEGEEAWPAVAQGPKDKWPFECGWCRFETEQDGIAQVAKRKYLVGAGQPSLWLTSEVQLCMANISKEAKNGRR